MKCAPTSRLGQAQQKTQGIKINLSRHGRVSAETGNIPLRDRWRLRHGGRPLDCYFLFVCCPEDLLYCFIGGIFRRGATLLELTESHTWGMFLDPLLKQK